MTAKIKETAMRLVFALAAVLSVLAVIFICLPGARPPFAKLGFCPFSPGRTGARCKTNSVSSL